MYLKALNSGLIVLDPGVEFLSVDNLPKVVSVPCCSNIFSHEIELPMDMAVENINNLPIVVEPFEAQNNNPAVELTEAKNITQLSKCTELPMTVENTELPMVVENTELRVVVENTELPMVVENNELPVVVENTELPMVVENNELPVVVENTELPVVVENTEMPMVRGSTELPVVVENTVPAIVGPIDKNLIWLINYEKELQGLLITDSCEVESPYYTIHSALLNTYVNYNYAIFILEGYMMAIIKQLNYFYIFDSHARDLNGMPDPNGTAIVITFSNILDLEKFLYSLSKKSLSTG